MIINSGPIFNKINADFSKGVSQLAVLIDPDKIVNQDLVNLSREIEKSSVNYILVGGSLVFSDIELCIQTIKDNTSKPVILFPGSHTQVSSKADAILLLSLISGRNPDYLIGNHVIAAPALYHSEIEIISTAYILVNGGSTTSVQYISNTQPIPSDKTDIILATALAGEMIGNKLIYLEAGSGANNSVPTEAISTVKSHCKSPIIVGGGFNSKSKISEAYNAGAGLVVIGTAIEKNPEILSELF